MGDVGIFGARKIPTFAVFVDNQEVRMYCQLCSFGVSLKNSTIYNFLPRKSKSIAVVSSDGELSIMQIKEDKLVLKSQVRGLYSTK
jgi:hypothetical protein